VSGASSARLLAAALLLLSAFAAQARIEPVGVWSCVLYGQDREDDERMLLDFRADGATWAAQLSDSDRRWVPLSYWSSKRGYLSFTDSRRSREYQADLDYVSLGGVWTDELYSGGWWCAPLEQRPNLTPAFGSFNEYAVMPRLIVDAMASPWYPKRAIREAKEGYAVACFLVQPDGFVTDAHFLELSDPIFQQPALGALHRSHYKSWDRDGPARPACRTFDFHLDGKRY
jgi:hypothetical protein